MARLLIKDVSEELLRRLEKRVAENRRSVGAEVVAMLEVMLNEQSEPPTLDEVDRMRVRGARPLTQALLDRARRDRP